MSDEREGNYAAQSALDGHQRPDPQTAPPCATDAAAQSARREALEEAAKIAENCYITFAAINSYRDEIQQGDLCRRDIAAHIRSLASSIEAGGDGDLPTLNKHHPSSLSDTEQGAAQSKRPVAFRAKHPNSIHWALFHKEEDAAHHAMTNGVEYEGLYLVADRAGGTMTAQKDAAAEASREPPPPIVTELPSEETILRAIQKSHLDSIHLSDWNERDRRCARAILTSIRTGE